MTEKRVYTIGFTKKSAETFFKALKSAGVRRVVDIRLNNVSQLAGFTKKEDLEFFLKEIGGIEYVHLPELAPSKEILDGYKKKKLDWAEYEKKYLALIANRRIEQKLADNVLDGDCFLCSEEKPDQCHRRLAVEHLAEVFGEMKIIHL